MRYRVLAFSLGTAALMLTAVPAAVAQDRRPQERVVPGKAPVPVERTFSGRIASVSVARRLVTLAPAPLPGTPQPGGSKTPPLGAGVPSPGVAGPGAPVPPTGTLLTPGGENTSQPPPGRGTVDRRGSNVPGIQDTAGRQGTGASEALRFVVAPDARITLDGRQVTLNELQPGYVALIYSPVPAPTTTSGRPLVPGAAGPNPPGAGGPGATLPPAVPPTALPAPGTNPGVGGPNPALIGPGAAPGASTPLPATGVAPPPTGAGTAPVGAPMLALRIEASSKAPQVPGTAPTGTGPATGAGTTSSGSGPTGTGNPTGGTGSPGPR